MLIRATRERFYEWLCKVTQTTSSEVEMVLDLFEQQQQSFQHLQELKKQTI